MRSNPRSYRLTFLLRPVHAPPAGGTTPILEGCAINVVVATEAGVQLEITGPSRERVFEQTAVLLRHAAKEGPPGKIDGTLRSPPPCSGYDSWSIIIAAGVAFSPTALDPYLPALEHGPAARPPPALLQEIKQ